jgi:hypothetical protein
MGGVVSIFHVENNMKLYIDNIELKAKSKCIEWY